MVGFRVVGGCLGRCLGCWILSYGWLFGSALVGWVGGCKSVVWIGLGWLV